MKYFSIFFFITTQLFADSIEMVKGRHFEVPVSQDINFRPLPPMDNSVNQEPSLPKVVDLRPLQSPVKHQGTGGSCTFFAITSLLESLIKQRQGIDVNLSEEYLRFASKIKEKLRIDDDGSSVAVNARTVQEQGLMLEEDMPYQGSWFEKGMPCENIKKTTINCFAHQAPSTESLKNIISGKNFVFKTIQSSSSDLVSALAKNSTPILTSVRLNLKSWANPTANGEVILNEEMIKECNEKPSACGGHVVLVVGYDLEKRNFTFKNTWGKNWADQGYGKISFDYIDRMSGRKFLTAELINSIHIPIKHNADTPQLTLKKISMTKKEDTQTIEVVFNQRTKHERNILIEVRSTLDEEKLGHTFQIINKNSPGKIKVDLKLPRKNKERETIVVYLYLVQDEGNKLIDQKRLFY